MAMPPATSRVDTSQPEEIAERLLRAREARGLIWSITARLAMYAVVLTAGYLLGVTMSSVGTLESCAYRMEDALGENRELRPVLDVHKENTGTIRKAGQRISGVVQSLQNFARLDEAEVQKADLRTGLYSTLALIRPETKGNAEVVKEYEDVPLVSCRPKELNQVFLMIVTNAFEAMEGKGTLRIHVGADQGQVRLEFSDTGNGMSPERLGSLFDIRFATSAGAVSMIYGSRSRFLFRPLWRRTS